jgi:hypothetical protein
MLRARLRPDNNGRDCPTLFWVKVQNIVETTDKLTSDRIDIWDGHDAMMHPVTVALRSMLKNHHPHEVDQGPLHNTLVTRTLNQRLTGEPEVRLSYIPRPWT